MAKQFIEHKTPKPMTGMDKKTSGISRVQVANQGGSYGKNQTNKYFLGKKTIIPPLPHFLWIK